MVLEWDLGGGAHSSKRLSPSKADSTDAHGWHSVHSVGGRGTVEARAAGQLARGLMKKTAAVKQLLTAAVSEFTTLG